MKIELDTDADAAYIYFSEIEPGAVAKTISLNESINIDLDVEGRTLGIEILNASTQLPAAALQNTEIINS